MDKVKMVKIADVIPTPDNPRLVDPKDPKIIELGRSIRELGLLQPILCRKHPTEHGKLDLRAGHRRLVAAEVAGLAEIPAIVREMTDKQAVEVTVTENLHRSDLTPLEEGNGIARLLEVGKNVREIAADLGVSVAFVYRRARLAKLSTRWVELAHSERGKSLSAGHLEAVARLPVSVQEALAERAHNWVLGQGLQVFENWIRDETASKLADAPWPLDDADLDPGAGACDDCERRSSREPVLFADMAEDGDCCLVRECYQRKRKAWLERRMAELEAKHKNLVKVSTEGSRSGNVPPWHWSEAKKTARGAKPALVMDGPEAGELKYVVVETPAGRPAATAEKKDDPQEMWLMTARRAAADLVAEGGDSITTRIQTVDELMTALALIYMPFEELSKDGDPMLAASKEVGAGGMVAKLAEWIREDLADSIFGETENCKGAPEIGNLMDYAGKFAEWSAWLKKNPCPTDDGGAALDPAAADAGKRAKRRARG